MGNILTITHQDTILCYYCCAVDNVSILFFKELQSVIFNREMAKAVSQATIFFYLILFLSGMTISTTLKSVGGLLVFALVINPAAAAYQITYSLKRCICSPLCSGSVWVGRALSCGAI